MGSQQQFCLRWNNHQSNMLSVFDDLFQNEALVDVTLACDGLSIKAHKMVLSACSPYFQTLFLDNPCKHPIVILKDIRFSDLKSLMDFMYKGEVNVSQEQLSTLLKTAETLKVRGLTEVANGNDIANNLSLPGGPVAAMPRPVPPPQPPVLPPLSQPAQQQQPSAGPSSGSPSGPPSPKRHRKSKHRHKDRGNGSSSNSEPEDSSLHVPEGSPELIEPKVEITEDSSLGDEQLVTSGDELKLRLLNPSAPSFNDFSNITTDGHMKDPQNFGNRQISLNATPPLLFPPVTNTSVPPSIGQPQVLQGTSQGHHQSREKHVRKWNEQSLAEAMEAVKSKKMSIIAACRQYEIPWGTLYRRLSLANIRSAYSRNDHSNSNNSSSNNSSSAQAPSAIFNNPFVTLSPSVIQQLQSAVAQGSSTVESLPGVGGVVVVPQGAAGVASNSNGGSE